MKDNKSRHFEGAQLLRQQFAQYSSGAFEQALSTQDICSVVEQQSKATARQRLYPPLKTLSLFIGQILCGARACRDAVVRNLSARLSSGATPNSLNTGAYFRAPLLGTRLDAARSKR